MASLIALTSSGFSSGSRAASARRQCFAALKRTAALPSGVLGPVERRAFARFAAICRSVVIFLPQPLFCPPRNTLAGGADIQLVGYIDNKGRRQTKPIRIASPLH